MPVHQPIPNLGLFWNMWFWIEVSGKNSNSTAPRNRNFGSQSRHSEINTRRYPGTKKSNVQAPKPKDHWFRNQHQVWLDACRNADVNITDSESNAKTSSIICKYATRIGYGECMVNGTGLGGVGCVDFCCSFGLGIWIGFAFSLIAALGFSNHFFGFQTSFGFGTFSFTFLIFLRFEEGRKQAKIGQFAAEPDLRI